MIMGIQSKRTGRVAILPDLFGTCFCIFSSETENSLFRPGLLPDPVGNDFRNIPKGIIIICFPGILSSDFIRVESHTYFISGNRHFIEGTAVQTDAVYRYFAYFRNRKYSSFMTGNNGYRVFSNEYICDSCGYRSNDDRISAMNLYELGKTHVSGDTHPRFGKRKTK